MHAGVFPKVRHCILLLAGVLGAMPLPGRTVPDIDTTRLAADLRILGDDAMEGRGTGTKGERRAAAFISGRLAEFGVAPLGGEGGFIQSIPMHAGRVLPGSRLVLHSGDGDHSLAIGDSVLLYRTTALTFMPRAAELVFVGHGISAPEFAHDDYRGIDVAGKIAVMLAGEPASTDPGFFDGDAPTIYSNPEAKQRLAMAHGALGSILIGDDCQGEPACWERLRRDFSHEDVSLAYHVMAAFGALIHPDAATALFAAAPRSLDAVRRDARQGSVKPFAMGAALTIEGRFAQREFRGRNVVGEVRGSDPRLADEYVLVTAHYDHLGIGFPVNGDSIYNGVFDNAVGVAAVLEMARLTATAPPARSVIFLFVTGEEKGLLGSRFYLDHPARPLSATVANLNVDGLSMIDEVTDLIALGGGYSTLGDMAVEFGASRGITVRGVAPGAEAFAAFARSDQVAFARAGIPAILLMEGFTYRNLSPEDGMRKRLEWMAQVYHTPQDDLHQSWSLTAMAQHTGFLAGFLRHLAEAPDAPRWRADAPLSMQEARR